MPETTKEKEYLWSQTPKERKREGDDDDSLEISATTTDETLSPNASFLQCVLPRGKRAQAGVPALVLLTDDEDVQAQVFVPTMLDAQCPRQHLVQLLPTILTPSIGSSAPSPDMRLPADPRVLPCRVVHVHDERGETCVVSYASAQKCLDGRWRKTMWYKCSPSHAEAERKVCAHVEAVLSRGGDATRVHMAAGKGELSGAGRIRHHGDPHENVHVRCYPKKLDFKASAHTVWKPERDTLMSPEEFCGNHACVCAFASGAKVYECLGHDVVIGDAIEKQWPGSFASEPLRGRTFVEVFSGNLCEGGGRLSEAWEAAGGTAILYDTRVDPEHSFLHDDHFWEKQFEGAKDAYHFAFHCHHMSIANTIGGKPRPMENPYGDDTNEDTRYYNRLVMVMVQRILQLVAAGAMATIGIPLLSYLYLLREMLGVICMPGACILRDARG